MANKFTQEEFIERQVEFIKNYTMKYRIMDLNFEMVMYMNGCSKTEFKDHMRQMSEKNQNQKQESKWEDEYDGCSSDDEDNDEYNDEYDGEDI